MSPVPIRPASRSARTFRRAIGALTAAGLVLAAPAPHAQGPMGGVVPDVKLVKTFDTNKDGWLNAAERAKARPSAVAASARGGGGPMGGFGPGRRGGRGDDGTPATPGPALTPAAIATFPSTPVYDDGTLRTLFLEFETADWEKELQDFHGTDVDVTATLVIDGQRFRDVGVRFRGLSSYMGVPEGRKRSLNVTLDLAHPDQAFRGVRTLNLLNSHEDPTFLRAVLYSHIARQFIPAPAANFVRVAINGESWGVYVNAEQFNKDFLQHWYGTTAGTRWKVPGSPGGRGGLEYMGDDPAAYARTFEIKTKDDPAAWAALIRVCKVLNDTPADAVERALSPLLDIDGVLRFLALDMALVNGDGYWTRASDYALYLDPKGVLHVVPHDMNEAFAAGGPGGGRGPGGPGGPGGRGPEGPGGRRGFGPPPDGRGVPGFPGGPGGMGPGRGAMPSPELDPLSGLDDATKPLRSKLLAVPGLRARYLAYVQEIASRWLDWTALGPFATRAQALIAPHVAADTKKLDAFEAASVTLQPFVEKRRAYLLK